MAKPNPVIPSEGDDAADGMTATRMIKSFISLDIII